MKIIGSTLVIFSSVAFSLMLIFEKERNIKELEKCLNFFSEIKNTIRFTLKSPQELFEESSIEELFLKERTLDHLRNGFSFKEAFLNAVKEDDSLSKKDKCIIEKLSSFLGLFDIDTEISKLQMLTEEISAILSARKDELAKKKNLYVAIGLSSSLMLVIILI